MLKLLMFLLAASFSIIATNSFAETKADTPKAAKAKVNNAKDTKGKIGYVDIEKILKGSPQAAASTKKLQSEFASRVSELELMGKRLNEQATAMNKNALTLSESDRQSKEQELNSSNIEFQRKKRELSEDVALRKKQEFAALQESIKKAVTVVAQVEGYDLVLFGSIAYNKKSIDITDKVIKAVGN